MMVGDIEKRFINGPKHAGHAINQAEARARISASSGRVD